MRNAGQVLMSRLRKLLRRTSAGRPVAIRMRGASPAEGVVANAPRDPLIAQLRYDPDLARRIDAALQLAKTGNLPEPAVVLAGIGLPGVACTAHHRTILHALAAASPVVVAELSFAEAFASSRAALVEALGAARDPGAASCLALHSADTDPQIRLAALRAACEVGDPAAARWTMQLLADPAETVIVKAVHTCVVLGTKAALPQLEPLAAHPSWWVRTRATQAIAALGAASAAGEAVVRAA